LSEKYLTSILKSPIFLNIIENAKAKEKIKLHKGLSSNVKKSSRILNIDKLEDANFAGTKNFEECTLILTEGDSAKSLAMSGIELVGRDIFGVYPLKGKFLNVREAAQNTILNNKEMQDLIKILGLKMGQDYTESLKGLRYGKVMIMADQDFDGSHIKGLVLNLFHYFWPSLLKRNDFLKEFITPIVKVSKLDKSKIINFYTINEYKNWYEENVNKNINNNNANANSNSNNNNNAYNKSTQKIKSQWNIKYYKGLGTSTSNEAKDYFRNIKKNVIEFKYKNTEDDDAIELAFATKKADLRKEWLSNLDINNIYIDHSKCEIRYKEFIDKELILFSHSDNIRSIPNLLDGLKPSERKILYAAFKRNLKSELKVAQLAGYVAEHSSYHHGEMALCSTITSMAQDFIGSNNINLLMPIGQFGNRYNGTKGAASPRYIYTCLNKITRLLYKEEDDNLFTYIVEEGQKIEPIYYVPILPMVLVNGCDGIGTGWSTNVPQYNPLDIADFLIKRLNNKNNINNNKNSSEDNLDINLDINNYLDIKPWFKGFKGEIIKTEKGFNIIGCIEILTEDNIVEITELPPKRWDIRGYKTFLEEFHIDNNEKSDKEKEKEIEIEDIKEYHNENKVHFRLRLKEESYKKITNLSRDDLLKLFKLTSSIGNTNMVLFDSNCKIKKYSKISEIFEEFYSIRLEYYSKRREALLNKLNYQLDLNTNKMNFIKMMLTGQVNFLNMNKKEVCGFLRSKFFEGNSELKKKYKNAFKVNSTDIVKDDENSEKENEDNDNDNDKDKDYSNNDFDYLMNMNIWSLTKDRINELENNVRNLNNEINFFKENDEKKLWIMDLEEFVNEYKVSLNQI
jgi:DNA topoisomerase-2